MAVEIISTWVKLPRRSMTTRLSHNSNSSWRLIPIHRSPALHASDFILWRSILPGGCKRTSASRPFRNISADGSRRDGPTPGCGAACQHSTKRSAAQCNAPFGKSRNLGTKSSPKLESMQRLGVNGSSPKPSHPAKAASIVANRRARLRSPAFSSAWEQQPSGKGGRNSGGAFSPSVCRKHQWTKLAHPPVRLPRLPKNQSLFAVRCHSQVPCRICQPKSRPIPSPLQLQLRHLPNHAFSCKANRDQSRWLKRRV
jgi:hypothetical protein